VLRAEVEHAFQYISEENERVWLPAFRDTVRLRFHPVAELRRNHASVAALSEAIVHKALMDLGQRIETLTDMSKVPSPIMKSEAFVAFDRELSRGFGIVRPEDGEIPQIDDVDTSPVALKDDEVEDIGSYTFPSSDDEDDDTFTE
jgi:hypothetical protein